MGDGEIVAGRIVGRRHPPFHPPSPFHSRSRPDQRLSRRWRALWAHLPEIRFPFPTDSAGVGPSLASSSAPALRRLHVACRDAAAARLCAGGELYFHNRTPREEKERVEAAVWQCPTFRLPKVWLRLGFVNLAVPPAGVFAGFTELRLERVNLHSERELCYMVSSPRCPALRGLRIARARRLVTLAIYSETLV